MRAVLYSLFKDGLMRKPNKSALRKALVDDKVPQCERRGEYVLDGGGLVHKVRWVKGETYGETARRYTEYVQQRFGKCVIVFDGYETVSTKDHEHQRRVKLAKTSADIQVLETNAVHNSQDAFLRNSRNKSQFIFLLTKNLRKEGHTVVNCEEDADTKVASAAIDLAAVGRSVTVIADDTDIIFLLTYHFQENMADIYFKSEKTMKTWSIRDIVHIIGPMFKNHILFLHAWLGCDTTSAVFSHGKSCLSKKIESSKELQM